MKQHRTSKNMYVYQHQFTSSDGHRLTLDRFRGQPVLLVNTASGSRRARQLLKLQSLWDNYRHFGLVIIGMPCNDFGQREPLENEQIAPEFHKRFGVRFPLTVKLKLTGRSVNPLFAEMQEIHGREKLPRWNFYKYLFNQRGQLADVWSHRTEPDDSVITHQIERNLTAWIL